MRFNVTEALTSRVAVVLCPHFLPRLIVSNFVLCEKVDFGNRKQNFSTAQEQDLRKTIFFKGQKNRTQKSDSCAILSPYRQILDDFYLT